MSIIDELIGNINRKILVTASNTKTGQRAAKRLTRLVEDGKITLNESDLLLVLNHAKLTTKDAIELFKDESISKYDIVRKELLKRIEAEIQLSELSTLTSKEKIDAILGLLSSEKRLQYIVTLGVSDRMAVIEKMKFSEVISVLKSNEIDFTKEERSQIISKLDESQRENFIKTTRDIEAKIEFICSLDNTKKMSYLSDLDSSISDNQKKEIIKSMTGNSELILKAISEANIVVHSVKIELLEDMNEENVKKYWQQHFILGNTDKEKLETYKKICPMLSDKSKGEIIQSKALKNHESDFLVASMSKASSDYKVKYFSIDSPESIIGTVYERAVKKAQILGTLSEEYEPLKEDTFEKLLNVMLEEKSLDTPNVGTMKKDIMQNNRVKSIYVLNGMDQEKKITGIEKLHRVLDSSEINVAVNLIMRNPNNRILPYEIEDIKSFIQIAYPDDYEKRFELLQKLKENNDDILSTIDLEILDDEYFQMFGNKMDLITRDYGIQSKICSLSEAEKFILKKFIPKIEDTAQFNEYLDTVLTSMQGKKYASLIKEFENTEEFDYDKFFNIVVSDSENTFRIKNIHDFDNYTAIRKKACEAIEGNEEDLSEEIKSMPEIDKKKMAYIERIYGHDINYARRVVRIYGNNIDKVENENAKAYLKSLKLIIDETDVEKIDRLADVQGIDEEIVDIIKLEAEIQRSYEEELNKKIFRINDKTLKYQGEEFCGLDDVYEALPNDILLCHVVSACSSSHNKEQHSNYYQFWNRKNFNPAHHTSCTILGKGKYRRADNHNVCFGISDELEGQVVVMGSKDMGVFTESNVITTHDTADNKFGAPEDILEETNSEKHNEGWNEIGIRSFKHVKDENGNYVMKKIQPGYIIVYKKSGKLIDDLAQVMQAKKDFEAQGKKLPIVVVDLDRCRATRDITEVTKEDLAYNYDLTKENTVDKREFVNKMKNMLNSVIQVMNKENEEER